jgi:hypothetical protein
MASDEAAQVHVRVSAQLKRAIKIFCAREGLTEQGWALQVLDEALASQAPDLASSWRNRRHGERTLQGKVGQRS